MTHEIMPPIRSHDFAPTPMRHGCSICGLSVQLHFGAEPHCDLCGGPMELEGQTWNGLTGNHVDCEKQRKDGTR